MHNHKRGSSMVEYGLILSLVGLTGMCGACMVGESLSDSFNDVGSKLFGALTGSGTAGTMGNKVQGAKLAAQPAAQPAAKSGPTAADTMVAEAAPVIDGLAQAMVGPMMGLDASDEELAALQAMANESVIDDPMLTGDPVVAATKQAAAEKMSKCSDGMDEMTVMSKDGAQVYDNTVSLTTTYAQTLELMATTATDNSGNPVGDDFAQVLQTLAKRGYTLANAQAAVSSDSSVMSTLTTGGVFASVDSFYNYYTKNVAPVLEQPQYSHLKAQLEYYCGTITKVAEVHYLQANQTNASFQQKLEKDYTIGGITTVDVTFADSATSTQQNSQNIETTSQQL